MKIGVITSLTASRRDALFEPVRAFGLRTCQLSTWSPESLTDELAAKVVEQSRAAGVAVAALWAGLPGPRKWNFTEGPVALGLVPPQYRSERVASLKASAGFARKIGAPAIVTHCGFIPENMTDPEYPPVVEAVREVAEHCASLGLEFWFETGQETPVVLLRIIQRVGTGNLGINLDPANLLLYGKGSPVDALHVFGQHVRNVHVKDGFPPTDGESLGREAQVGRGMVRFPEFVAKLKGLGFDGEWIIEREIAEGEGKNRDIQETVSNLREWWAQA